MEHFFSQGTKTPKKKDKNKLDKLVFTNSKYHVESVMNNHFTHRWKSSQISFLISGTLGVDDLHLLNDLYLLNLEFEM